MRAARRGAFKRPLPGRWRRERLLRRAAEGAEGCNRSQRVLGGVHPRAATPVVAVVVAGRRVTTAVGGRGRHGKEGPPDRLRRGLNLLVRHVFALSRPAHEFSEHTPDEALVDAGPSGFEGALALPLGEDLEHLSASGAPLIGPRVSAIPGNRVQERESKEMRLVQRP
ncbi:hypothetical protein GCM10012319_15090 [Comamonas sp. KCTC 72670]|nr:hypothetical protein GCM10012319_15090 [Comamonas sp. KCTC 72670]